MASSCLERRAGREARTGPYRPGLSYRSKSGTATSLGYSNLGSDPADVGICSSSSRLIHRQVSHGVATVSWQHHQSHRRPCLAHRKQRTVRKRHDKHLPTLLWPCHMRREVWIRYGVEVGPPAGPQAVPDVPLDSQHGIRRR